MINQRYRIRDEAVVNGDLTTGMMVELCADFTANHRGRPWEDWREMGISLSQIQLPAEARKRLRKYFQDNPRERRTPQEDFPRWLRVFYSPYRNIFVISFDGSRLPADSFNPARWNQFIQLLRENPSTAAAQAGEHEKNNIERSVIARDLVKGIAEACLSYRNQWEFFKPTLKPVVYGATGIVCLVGILVPLLHASRGTDKPADPLVFIGFLFQMFCVLCAVSALYFLTKKWRGDILLTGHGVGGHIAEDVVLDLKKYHSITFESPGVSLPSSSGRASMDSFICDATRLASMPKHAGQYIHIDTTSARGTKSLEHVRDRVRFLSQSQIRADVISDGAPSPGINSSLDEVANLVSQSGEDAASARRSGRR